MSTNFICKDDSGFKGRLLPLRGSSKLPQNSPFLSRVTVKEQLGLPPVGTNLKIKYLPLPKNKKLERYIKKNGLLIPLLRASISRKYPIIRNVFAAG